eukprot:4337976-Amphidinium_carterae.3
MSATSLVFRLRNLTALNDVEIGDMGRLRSVRFAAIAHGKQKEPQPPNELAVSGTNVRCPLCWTKQRREKWFD